MRDREILSDYDYFRSVVDIVEHAKRISVKLTSWRGDNYVKHIEADNYELNVANPVCKGISKAAALAHECGHLLAESPFTEMSLVLKRWSSVDRKFQLYWKCYNIIEDQRIEFFVQNKWKVNKERFYKTRIALGKNLVPFDDDPLSELLATRFFRFDMVKNKKRLKTYQDCLKLVEGTGRWGSLKILLILKPILDEWFIKQKDFTPQKTPLTLNPFTKNEYNEADLKKIEEIKGKFNDLIDSTKKIDEKSLNKLLEEDRDDFKKNMKSLNESIQNNSMEQPKMKKKYNLIDRQTKNYFVNKKMSSELERFLKKIKERKTISHNDFGLEVDVEQYIENKITNKDRTKVMISEAVDDGIAIVLSIDASGSMESYNNNMARARNLVSTLFDAVKNQPQINVRANVWASDDYGKVGITEIKNIKDCEKITYQNPYGLTPTHLALEYSAEQIEKMSGRKKLVILITDGKPEYRLRKHLLSTNQMITICKKSFTKARSSCPNITCILLNPKDLNEPKRVMEAIFGKRRFMNVSDMEQASEKVIKQFKQMVIRNLK